MQQSCAWSQGACAYLQLQLRLGNTFPLHDLDSFCHHLAKSPDLPALIFLIAAPQVVYDSVNV